MRGERILGRGNSLKGEQGTGRKEREASQLQSPRAKAEAGAREQDAEPRGSCLKDLSGNAEAPDGFQAGGWWCHDQIFILKVSL